MMRNLRTAIVIAVAAAAACGKTRDESRGLSATGAAEEQGVLAAEDAFAAVEVRRDEMALRRYIDDQFVRNQDDGTTSGKEDFIAAVLRLKLVNQTISERSVVVEGTWPSCLPQRS